MYDIYTRIVGQCQRRNLISAITLFNCLLSGAGALRRGHATHYPS